LASDFEPTFAPKQNSFNGTYPLADRGERYVPELSEGDGVRHELFGLGTVLELDGDNAMIYFKGKGTKRLNIAFAPLEKL
jgi:hypothetical protein